MEPDRQAKLKSYAWLTALAMLLALFVPLASAGAQDDGGPDGDTLSAQAVAEEGGTLDATPESATNMVDETHTITAAIEDDDADDEDFIVRAEIDEEDVEPDSYSGGLPPDASEECTTDDAGEDDPDECDLNFNEGRTTDDESDDEDYAQPTPGKDRIRVYHDANDNGVWDEDEDFDFVTKTWVDETSEGDVNRLFGRDRIGTAVDISQHKWLADDAQTGGPGQEQTDHVVLARADLFPDALAGSPFAVRVNGPLLLTFPDSLEERTEEEIQRVLGDDGTVFLLGQTDALSLAVEARLQELGYDTVRLGGLTRFETAVEIAEETEERQDGLDHVFIARSHEFPDALTGGAAAASVGPDGNVGAILLTFDQVKPEQTEEFLADHPDVTTYGLGGPNFNPYSCAVDVDHDDDGTTDTWLTQSRCEDDTENPDNEDPADWGIFGVDRHETARAIAEFFFVDPENVGFARSDLFPDALTGGAHIGQFNGPILLTPTDGLHQDPERYVCFTADTIETGFIYGGDHAIAVETEPLIDDAIDGGEVCQEHDLPGHWVGS